MLSSESFFELKLLKTDKWNYRTMKRFKNTTIVIFCFTIAIVSFAICTLNILISMQNVITDNKAEISKMLCYKVSDEIVDGKLFQSVDVVETMLANTLLSEVIQFENSKISNELIFSYLSRLKDRFDFNNVTVALVKNNYLYTADGNAEIIDKNNKNEFGWYYKFLKNDEDLKLSIGKDGFHDGTMNIFANAKYYNPKTDEVEAVVSVGFKLSKISEDIAALEQLHGVNIDFVDSNGNVVLSSDNEGIGKLYPLFEDESLKKDFLRNSHFYFRNLGSYGSCTSGFIPEINLYIIVYDEHVINSIFSEILSSNLVCFIIYLLVIACLSVFIIYKDRILSKIFNIDRTSGLYNRSFFTKYSQKIATRMLSADLYVVCFDLVYLKQINAKYGSEGEKECILAFSSIIFNILAPFGKCFRTDESEFKVIIEIDHKNFIELMEKVREEIKKWHGRTVPYLSVKIGITCGGDNLNKSLEEYVNEANYNVYHENDGVNAKGYF